MQIHQMQLRYDINADRLLLQVRSREAELFGVWLTRRMVSRLRPPFQQAVTRLGLAHAAPQAMPVPEARAMLEQAVRDRPLPNADFAQPFETENVTLPLGPEPLLPAEIDIRGLPRGGLVLSLREARGRRLELALNDELATALLRLLDKALAAADWGLAPAPAAEASAAPTGPLN
jgi:hypothetical protein